MMTTSNVIGPKHFTTCVFSVDVNTLIKLALLMVILQSHGTSSRKNMKIDRTLYVKNADVLDLQASICFLPLLKIVRGKRNESYTLLQ